MKTKMILLLALVGLFSGCDKIKDATTVPIDTSLKADIPVVVVAPVKKSVDQAGEVSAINFTKSQDLTLASNADIEPYLSKIKSIDLKSLVITITGLSAGQTINSIALDVTGVGNVFTQTNITSANGTFTPVISASILDAVATKLTSDKKIPLTLSGNTSGPMTFTASLNFGVTVTAGVL
jgi:hypothetical protein